MQVIRSFDQADYAVVGRAVSVLVVGSDDGSGPLGRKLAALGAKVDTMDEIYAALSDIIDDPQGYGLLVVDCDTTNIGGLEAGLRLVQMLGTAASRIPVILISAECREQRFPQDRSQPVVLRAPVSAVSLKVGYEHALRERFLFRAA